MLLGILIGTLVVVMGMGGKAMLTAMVAWPVIGGFVAWYTGLVGPLPPGFVSNLVYGGMAAQIVIMGLAIPLYGASFLRRWTLKKSGR